MTYHPVKASPHPSDYLRQYFTELSVENKWLMLRLETLYERYKPQGIMLEIGGGPTIYQLISAARFVERIIFSDKNPKNIAEVARWISRQDSAFDWAEYFACVASVAGLTAAKLEDLLRQRLTDVKLLNVLDLPTEEKRTTGYGLISSLFCLEAAVSSRETLLELIRNVGDLLAPGGLLVLGFLRNCREYRVGCETVATVPIDERFIRKALRNRYFYPVDLETLPANGDNGYDGLMVLGAIRTGIDR